MVNARGARPQGLGRVPPDRAQVPGRHRPRAGRQGRRRPERLQGPSRRHALGHRPRPARATSAAGTRSGKPTATASPIRISSTSAGSSCCRRGSPRGLGSRFPDSRRLPAMAKDTSDPAAVRRAASARAERICGACPDPAENSVAVGERSTSGSSVTAGAPTRKARTAGPRTRSGCCATRPGSSSSTCRTRLFQKTPEPEKLAEVLQRAIAYAIECGWNPESRGRRFRSRSPRRKSSTSQTPAETLTARRQRIREAERRSGGAQYSPFCVVQDVQARVQSKHGQRDQLLRRPRPAGVALRRGGRGHGADLASPGAERRRVALDRRLGAARSRGDRCTSSALPRPTPVGFWRRLARARKGAGSRVEHPRQVRKRAGIEPDKSTGTERELFDRDFLADLAGGSRPTGPRPCALLRLIEAALRDPIAGVGKPEPLKYSARRHWSRCLTQEHRLRRTSLTPTRIHLPGRPGTTT